MKTIVSALIALSVLVGVAGPANALDAKKFWDEHPTSGDRNSDASLLRRLETSHAAGCDHVDCRSWPRCRSRRLGLRRPLASRPNGAPRIATRPSGKTLGAVASATAF